MDPLSITASAIAIIGACRELVKGFKLLKQVSRAPEDILSLTDELNDLQNTLTAISLVTQNHRNEFVGILLAPLFHKVEHIIRELYGLCAVCPNRRKDVEDDVYTDEQKIQLLTRFKWTRERRRVSELRERLKVVRLDFANSLATVTLLEISCLTSELSSPSNTTKAQNEHQTFIPELAPLPPDHQVDDPCNMLNASQKSPKAIEIEAQRQSPCNSPTEKSTSRPSMTGFGLTSNHCEPACGCACHRVYRIKSPHVFQNVVGSLLIKSSGLYGITQACNEFSCSGNSSTSMHISYRFPDWFLNRMISSVVVSNPPCGPQMSLVFPRIVPIDSKIMSYAFAGNMDGIARLFEQGLASPFDVSNNYGYTALHYAADKGHVDLCRFLLNAGARPDITDLDENTVTDIAWNKICSNRIEPTEAIALEEIFKKDDWLEERNFSILHKIVLDLLPKVRSLEQELSASTSTIDLADSDGRTPLSWAAERGNASAVETLLRYGANLSRRSVTSMTPLHYAAKAPDSACLKILIDNGASVAAKNKWNQSPLNIASFFQDDSSFIDPLLDHGADINEQDCYKATALICSTFMNNLNTAAYLISRGADINSQDRMGLNASNESIGRNSHECTSLLLESGVDLSVADQAGDTALHFVARYADLQTLGIFLGAELEGLDPEARNDAGLTARELFAQRVDVSADVEKAFLHLMGMLDAKGTCSRFFDAAEKLPLPEKATDTVHVTVEVMAQ